MSLLEQIDADLLVALKSKDELTRDVLRFLKSSLKNAEISHNGQALTDEQVVQVIQKEVKRRHEAVVAYERAVKPELAEAEKNEAVILNRYLPALKTEAEIRTIVQDYLAKNPTSTQDFGRAMGALGQQLKGRADLAVVAGVLKAELGQQDP